MTQHQGEFTIERQVPAAEAAPGIAGQLANPPQALPRPARRWMRKALLVGVGALAFAGAGHFGWQYWTVGQFEVSTDDAYVQADNTTIAPKVSGYVAAVLVGDNEPVKAGQILARIDDRDFRVALDQAKADVAAARAAIASKEAPLEAQQSVIDAATRDDRGRPGQPHLRRSGRTSATPPSPPPATAACRTPSRRLPALPPPTPRSRATRRRSRRRSGRSTCMKAELAQAQAALAHDEAVQSQAELNLAYTDHRRAGRRRRRQPHAARRPICPGRDATDVGGAGRRPPMSSPTSRRPSSPTSGPDSRSRSTSTCSPATPFSGHVDSIAPASGQEFALLPPDNATGNFTKVVQRIPVKIVLDPGSRLADALRPGMSVTPTIDTKAPDREARAAVASKS